MSAIPVTGVGCSGRMGRMLMQAVLDDPKTELVGATERPGSEHVGQDVGALIEIMCDARHEGLDIGSAPVLQRYQDWRRFDATATALSMDGIDRVFSNDSNVLKPLRGLALTFANRVKPLRRAMARQASADQPSLPKLLRGEPAW